MEHRREAEEISAISQFLNGVIPLSTKATMLFAKALGVHINQIDPRFNAVVPNSQYERKRVRTTDPNRFEDVFLPSSSNEDDFMVLYVTNHDLEPFIRKGAKLVIDLTTSPEEGDDVVYWQHQTLITGILRDGKIISPADGETVIGIVQQWNHVHRIESIILR